MSLSLERKTLPWPRLLESLGDLAWSDLEQVHRRVAPVLEVLSAPCVLRELLSRTAEDERLLSRCERFRLFEKVVLHEQPGLRLRLHVFGEHLVEEVHNHRAPFVARVLHGRYRHLLYGDVRSVQRQLEPPYFAPLFVQEQLPGTSYAIHENILHSTVAEPNTFTLMLQGPATLQSFDIVDLKGGIVRTRYGGSMVNAPQEPGESTMDRQRLMQIAAMAKARGLV